MRRASTALLAVLLLLSAIFVATQEIESSRELRRRHGRPRHKHKHKKYPEPDCNRPRRKFRGGRVRHPLFEGSGCPASSVELVNATDTSSFALSALFSQFQAQTTDDDTRVRKTCTITVVLEPEEGMTIGVSHVDFRGNAYVPESVVGAKKHKHSTSEATLHASYRLGRSGREKIADRTYTAGFDNDIYEALDVNPVAWTPCDDRRQRVFEFRITASITATKRAKTDEDVAIAIDSSDSYLQKGLYYELTTKPCGQAGLSADIATSLPTKEPTTTEPAVIEAPPTVTEPATTEVPTTKPPTEAPATEPPTTKPAVTEVPTTEPPTTEPSPTEPPTSETAVDSAEGSGSEASTTGEPEVGSPEQ